MEYVKRILKAVGVLIIVVIIAVNIMSTCSESFRVGFNEFMGGNVEADYQSGHSFDYLDGYNAGEYDGREAGYDDGYEQGLREGYEDGYEAKTESLLDDEDEMREALNEYYNEAYYEGFYDACAIILDRMDKEYREQWWQENLEDIIKFGIVY